MVLERKPAIPLSWNDGNYAPAGGYAYYPKKGEDFVSIARRDGRSDTWDLIRDNFATSDPREVNWYLHRFVGCTASNDGKNYSFSDSDRVKMSDGTSRPGRIFTRTDLRSIPVGPPDPHAVTRTAVLDAMSRYSGTIARLNFVMHGFHIHGSDYRTVKDMILVNRVRVQHNPHLSEGQAEYDSDFDVLILRGQSFASPLKAAHLVHELTHAICDSVPSTWMRVRHSESIAYVAQCLFMALQGHTIEDVPAAPTILPSDSAADRQAKYRKFDIGCQIARRIKAGTSTVSGDDEAKMLWAVKNAGYSDGPTRYNGIAPKRENHFPGEVIPYEY